MSRYTRLALVLVALIAYVSAWTFPDSLLLMPRNNVAPRLVTDSSPTTVPPGGLSGNTGTDPGTGATSTTSSTDSTSSVSSTSTSVTSATTPPSTTATTTSASTTTTTPSATTTTSNAVSSTTTSATSTVASTTSSTDSSSSSSTTAATTTTQSVHQSLTTLTMTSNGHQVTSVGTATYTDGQSTSTSAPGLAQGYGGGSSSLSSVGKKVIAGIVGGVGGALLLAGIGYVVYRVWFRKNRHEANEDDYFVVDNSTSQKGRSASGGWGPTTMTDKFSEPLDRYKSPTSPQSTSYKSPSTLNAASNF